MTLPGTLCAVPLWGRQATHSAISPNSPLSNPVSSSRRRRHTKGVGLVAPGSVVAIFHWGEIGKWRGRKEEAPPPPFFKTPWALSSPFWVVGREGRKMASVPRHNGGVSRNVQVFVCPYFYGGSIPKRMTPKGFFFGGGGSEDMIRQKEEVLNILSAHLFPN